MRRRAFRRRRGAKGEQAGEEMLEALERGNLFVIALDAQRHWYRYHHLFAEVLRARLLKEQPAQVPNLHRRASAWYEQNDLPSDAIRHALAGADFERAAALVERTWPAMRRRRQEATVLRCVRALPDSLFHARPVLSVVSAWAHLDGGEYDVAEAYLQEAERWLDEAKDEAESARIPATEKDGVPMVVADEAQYHSLRATIANARAYRAQALDDIPGTVFQARQALELLQEDGYYERGTTTALLGLAYWASGDLQAAPVPNLLPSASAAVPAAYPRYLRFR